MKRQLKYNYIGTDQYGNEYMIEKHPRKELCEQLGTTHAEKMYTEFKDGTSEHTGYVIRDRWISIIRIAPWK
jgi:hypothetical protein